MGIHPCPRPPGRAVIAFVRLAMKIMGSEPHPTMVETRISCLLHLGLFGFPTLLFFSCLYHLSSIFMMLAHWLLWLLGCESDPLLQQHQPTLSSTQAASLKDRKGEFGCPRSCLIALLNLLNSVTSVQLGFHTRVLFGIKA